MVVKYPALSHYSFTERGLQSPPLRGFPALSWATSESVAGGFAEGSAIGTPESAYIAALGEHRERLHFYQLGSSAPHKTDYLYNLGDDALISFAEALFENSASNSDARQILDYRFRLLPVWNLFENTKAYFPEVYFSLNPRHPERNFLSLTDSTGCASHATAELSIKAAFYEFCERQSLLYHWFAGTLRGELNWFPQINELPYPRLWQVFSEMGELRVFDISLFEDIPAVLCLYRAQAPHPVQYLISTASAANLMGAMQSAIEELWQGYCFMLNYLRDPERVDKSGDRYIRHFVKCNHPQTVEAFAAWNQRGLPLIDLKFQQRADNESVINLFKKLQPWTDKLFLYTFQQVIGSSAVYYSKVFSTDFFPFMAVDRLPAEIPVLCRNHIHRHRFSQITPLPFP
jgi:hypothetical protein